MSLDQWADAVITAQTNDGYSDSNWIRYAKLAKLYKNQYIDLNHNTHPIPEGLKTLKILYLWIMIGRIYCGETHGLPSTI